MTAPRHMASPRWVVECADRLVRHRGFFVDLDRAEWWASHPGCCPMGRHRVLRADARQEVA